MAIYMQLPQEVSSILIERDFVCFVCGKLLSMYGSGKGYELIVTYGGEEILRKFACSEHMSVAMVLLGNLEQWLKKLDKPPQVGQLLEEIDRLVGLVSSVKEGK